MSNATNLAKLSPVAPLVAPTVDSIAALRTMRRGRVTRVFVLGYYTPGDGGGGVYYLDSTGTDNGGSVIVASDGGVWKLVVHQEISVKQFGARGDSSDDAAALKRAFDNCLNLAIPEGDFATTQRITVQPGTTVRNYGGWLVWAATTSGVRTSILRLPRMAAGITLHDLWFRNTSPQGDVYGVIGESTQGVTLLNPVAEECCVLHTYPTNAEGVGQPYAGVVTNRDDPLYNQCSGIVVKNYKATGRGYAITTGAAVELFYASNWNVDTGDVTKCGYGLQFWGGNSNYLFDGALTGERKCFNGRAVNITASYGHAGVWGSMGQMILMANNHSEYMTDVGIDPEGCIDTLVINNTSRHCVNGCYSGFFYNRGVTFRGNKAYQDGTWGTLMFKSYNSANTPIPDYIVDSNEFVWGGATGFGDVVLDPGMDTMQFTNNRLVDCKLTSGGNNMGRGVWGGNTYHYTRTIPANTVLVSLGANHGKSLHIDNDRWTSDVLQTDTSVVLCSITQWDGNATVPTWYRNCMTENFAGPTTLRCIGASANGGVVMPFNILSNQYDGPIVDGGVAGRTTIRLSGNRDYFGVLHAGQT